MNTTGQILLHRKIIEWEWYGDINTCRLFIHMLLIANWKEGHFRGTTVPRGSFVSSLDKLSEETRLTKREIRTAISHLKTTGEVTVKTTNKFSVFTIKNYALYQSFDMHSDTQETKKRHYNDSLTTLIDISNKGNKVIKDNNICPEPENSAPTPSGISLPLNDKSCYDVPLDKIALWRETYPAVDIEQELRRMIAWLDSNPAKRKTRRGVERFVNNWLARTPDGNEFRGRLKKREQILTKNAIYLSSDYAIDDYGEASFLDKPVPKNGEFRSCQSMIPFEYLGVTAKDFDWMAYGADDPIAKESKMLANAFVINFPKWRQKGKGLYIYSTTKRTGKTFLSFCLANEVMGRNDANLKYVNIIDYFDLTKRTYSSADDREERDKIMKAAVLILDDIGVDVSREWMNTKLYQMLDYRSLHKLVTIITSNYKVEQLKVDDRVKSRINDMCLPLHIPEIPIGEIKSDKENAEFVRSVMKTNSESH